MSYTPVIQQKESALYPEQHRTAIHWWIESFIETQTSKNFCLRINELQEMTADERKKMPTMRYRNKRYDIQFQAAENFLLILPNTNEAEWARGVIWYDENEHRFHYRTSSLLKVDVSTTLELR